MFVTLLPFLMLGASSSADNGKPKLILNISELTVHMNEIISIPFVIKELSGENLNLSAKSSDDNIVTVNTSDFDPDLVHEGVYKSSINVTGVFLGNADVYISDIDSESKLEPETIKIVVIRSVRLVDALFTASVAILVSILYINFGCAMDWDVCKKTVKKPIGPMIGCLCQFILMPLLSYGLAVTLFPESPEMQLGIFFTGISPSGGASNIWTMLLGGNLNLSVTMTTLCTIAAFGLMPMWIFTLGKHIFERGNLGVPYDKVATFAVGLIIPLAIGYFIQKKLPRLSKLMVRMMKPFSVVLIVFIIIFAIVTNLYLFKLFSWKIILAGMGLPWSGFLIGMIVAFLLRQPDQDIRAIAIETGIQNTGVAIFLLRFSLKQPAADLTTVIPVSCAIMTPIPLATLYAIKIVLDRRKIKQADSREKLQNHSVTATSIPNSLLSNQQLSQ